MQHTLRRIGIILLWALPLLLAAGCARGPRVIIPLQENAGKQYVYAAKHRAQSNLELITDLQRFLKARAVVREHYLKVAEFFPGDRKYTPLALLEVAEIDAGLDFSRVKPAKKGLRAGIKRFQKLAAEYPEFKYLQAKTKFDEGLCQQKLFEYTKAMECFKQVRDRYTDSKDKDIRDLARIAAYYYNQSHTHE